MAKQNNKQTLLIVSGVLVSVLGFLFFTDKGKELKAKIVTKFKTIFKV
nr:hypothetical protein [Pedobacter sp. ASV2]